MQEILNVYKPQGVTPVQVIAQLRKQKPEYSGVKIGFAGRLDPLAHGVLVLTVGETNKDREQYLNLNKTYQFSVLFGVETDTYDYLGILKDFDGSGSKLRSFTRNEDLLKEQLQEFMKRYIGKISQAYPPFSSKTLNGMPLFKLAKRGKIKEEDLPIREVEVFEFRLLSTEQRSAEVIYKEIMQNLKKIKGYFRQGRIIKQWEIFFSEIQNKKLMLAHFEIECSSGTYVRSLAQKLGRELGCGAIAFEIFRVDVGAFNIRDSLRLLTAG